MGHFWHRNIKSFDCGSSLPHIHLDYLFTAQKLHSTHAYSAMDRYFHFSIGCRKYVTDRCYRTCQWLLQTPRRPCLHVSFNNPENFYNGSWNALGGAVSAKYIAGNCSIANHVLYTRVYLSSKSSLYERLPCWALLCNKRSVSVHQLNYLVPFLFSWCFLETSAISNQLWLWLPYFSLSCGITESDCLHCCC